MEKPKLNFKKHYHHHKHFIPYYFVFFFYPLLLLVAILAVFPPAVVAAETKEVGLDENIEIEMWGFVNKDSIEVRSNYDTPLKANLINSSVPFRKKLVIVPSDLFYPKTGYQIEIITKNVLGYSSKKTVNLTTKTFPQVHLVTDFKDKEQIPSVATFEFSINESRDQKFLGFSAEPKIDYDKIFENGILKIVPKKKLTQGQTYKISLFLASNTLENKVLFTSQFTVIKALEIVASNPSDNASNVPKQAVLEFSFNKIVDQKDFPKKLKVEPKFDYVVSWKDGQNLVLTPNTLLWTSTNYTVTFADSLSGIDGSQLANEKTVDFTTSSKVRVVSFTPSGNQAGTNSSLSVAFDQPVDQASAQAKFSITPEVNGSFSWSGNTLKFKPSSLSMLTTYIVTIASGVKSIGGEDSAENFSHSFSTTSERVKTIGYSVRNRPITATYFGVGQKKILLIGSMHGNESNTGSMLNSWISYLRSNQKSIGSDRTFIIVPFANPDGKTSNYRFNANNVDLNRNFDLPDWQPLTYWQNRSYPNGGGSSPFSEPESRALRDLVFSENPILSITYHANANLVLGDGIAQSFGDWYADLTGYTRSQSDGTESDISALGYIITGTYEEWVTKRGVKTLVVEFISQTANEYSRNLPALKGLLTYPI